MVAHLWTNFRSLIVSPTIFVKHFFVLYILLPTYFCDRDDFLGRADVNMEQEENVESSKELDNVRNFG